MSYIHININITGDVVRQNVSFTPSMNDTKIKATMIYFPPMVVLSNSKILKAVKDINNVKEILTNSSMFNQFLQYYTDRAKGYKKMSIDKSRKLGIIDTNFKFMHDLWLKKKSRIIIDDRVYNIINSTIANVKIPTSLTNLRFEMTVDVKVIRRERDSIYNRIAINCDKQRERINRLYETSTGKPFFQVRELSTKPLRSPVMYSNYNNRTSGRRQVPSSSISNIRRPNMYPQYYNRNMYRPYTSGPYTSGPYTRGPYTRKGGNKSRTTHNTRRRRRNGGRVF